MRDDVTENKWVTKMFETDLAREYQVIHCESDKETFAFDMHLHLGHVEMLYKQQILTKEEARQLLAALLKLQESGPDAIEIREGRVDLFSNLEDWLVAETGIDAGGKFHIGRSRNDMNCNLSRMICRAYLIDFALAAVYLINKLLAKGEQHIYTVMPGFTHHHQHAQPTTMGHYLLWGVDSFLRDLERAESCYERLNRCSMGGAALCTTGFPIDRTYVAELLGFNGVTEHSIDAAGSRDFMLDMGSVLSIFQSNLNRLSELLMVWNIREIGMVRLARKYTSYSSIMPQKVNPVGIEMVRNKATDVYGRLNSMFIALKGTTPGNGREPSYLDEYMKDIIEKTIPAAFYIGDMVWEMEVFVEQCLKLAKEGFSTMTELADELVRLKGISFYMAHKIVGALSAKAVKENLSCEAINGEMVDACAEELYGRPLGMTDDEIKRALDPTENVKHRSILGGPSFVETGRMIADRKKKTEEILKVWQDKKAYQTAKIRDVEILAREIIAGQK